MVRLDSRLRPDACEDGVPSRTLTGNLTLRTRPLCVLSYGDKRSNAWPVFPPAKSPRAEAAGAASRSGVQNSLPSRRLGEG